MKKIKSKKTIAIIEHEHRTYYFDIMSDYSFTINLDEHLYFKSKSFKECFVEFQNIATNRNSTVILIDK